MQMKRFILVLIQMSIIGSIIYGASISGYVSDSSNGERIDLASVFIESTSRGTFTNEEGYFVINELPADKFEIVVSHIGYKPVYIKRTVRNKTEDIFIKVELRPVALKMEETEVVGSKWEQEINSREISI